MEVFKITVKYQVTVPKKVREFLGLKKGDCIEYKIDNEKVILNKISKADNEYLRYLDTLLLEWSSYEDQEAYNDL